MRTRRDFLKALLGAALVVPAVAACRTIAPEAVELPASIDAESMLAAYRDIPVNYHRQYLDPTLEREWNKRHFADANNIDWRKDRR